MVVCRRHARTRAHAHRHTHAHACMERNESSEQLVSVRIPVNHCGLSVTTMTDRIMEGFVVCLKS